VSARRPDLLIVLFDCLRARDFPGGTDPVPGMPFAEGLMRESIVFPKATSPAPWTIPSHAGLFSGQYPWESGVHAYRSLLAGDALPRLPMYLRSVGYKSLSLSANPFVSPRFGLTTGFDRACWGGWWEAFLRTPRDTAPNSWDDGQARVAQESDRTMEWIRDGPFGEMLKSASQQSFRFPFALDTGSRFLQKLRNPTEPRGLSQTPWIESELARWLRQQPDSTPVFCFLNLTDTHEPYYPDPELVHGLRDWWRLARVRQDHALAVSGEWVPTPEECRQLRELYRQMVRHLDVRLKGIVKAFQDAGRWDRTVAAITSDHGQSLGEHGMMFHLLRLDEPLLRIPLWLRIPDEPRRGRRATGWASLIDVAPTFLDLAGHDRVAFASSTSLLDLVDQPRSSPVYSMADGIVWPHIRHRFSSQREAEWERVLVAGYQDDFKVIVDAATGDPRAFNVTADPNEDHDLWPTDQPVVNRLADDARSIGATLLGRKSAEVDAAVEERLRAWGYV
jgi:arylsulfatase A-like enzyme